MQYSETEDHILGKYTCDPLKHIMDNPILIVAIFMGKSIFPDTREAILYKQHLQDLSPLQDSYNIFYLD